MSRHRIYFEKQGANRMCGLHCLNAIVQGPLYHEGDLTQAAASLDAHERTLLTPRSRANFHSGNVALDGHFSFSVIEACLRKRRLDCIPWLSERASLFRQNPGLAVAYLLHTNDHWLCLRKVNKTWYRLDSLRAAPQRLSGRFEYELDDFMKRGYLVFIVMPEEGRQFPSVDVQPDRLRPHQMLLTEEESEKLLKDEEERLIREHEELRRKEAGESSPTFLQPRESIDPAQLFKGVAQSAGKSTLLRFDDVDADTREAIELSLQQQKSLLPVPVAEPASGLAILVRLPDGSRMSRLFSEVHTAEHLCQWVEYESNVLPALCNSPYSLKRPYSELSIRRQDGKVISADFEVSRTGLAELLGVKSGDREQLIVSYL